MNEYGIYRVCGNRAYRGHEPGEEFVARLDPYAEARAIYRGSIKLLDRVIPELPDKGWKLPKGWTEVV